MTLRSIALLLAACACATAQAQDSYVNPPSDWAMDPIQPAAAETPPPERKPPPKQQPAQPPRAAQPAGPRPVAVVPDQATLQMAPQIEGPGASPDAGPQPEVRNSRRLRLDSSFSAFEAVEPPPPVTPPGDTSAKPAPAPQIVGVEPPEEK